MESPFFQDRQISVITHTSLNQDVHNQDGISLGYVPETLFNLILLNGNENGLTGIVLAKISLSKNHTDCVGV